MSIPPTRETEIGGRVGRRGIFVLLGLIEDLLLHRRLLLRTLLPHRTKTNYISHII